MSITNQENKFTSLSITELGEFEGILNKFLEKENIIQLNSNTIIRFNKMYGLDYSKVQWDEYLEYLVKLKVLNRKFQIMCPRCDTKNIVNDVKQSLGSGQYCIECRTNYKLYLKNINIVYIKIKNQQDKT